MRAMRIGVLSLSMLVCGLLGNSFAGDYTAAPAPAFELITLDGETYSNNTLGDRPALLVFWAPWCQVCQRELPEIARFYERDSPERLRVLSIGFADLRSNVEAFIKARPESFKFPTAYDDERWLAQAFRVNATPTYVLLDPQGRIALTHRGGGILQNPKFRELLRTFGASKPRPEIDASGAPS